MPGIPQIKLTTAYAFFQTWTPESAYVYGLLFADGNVTIRDKHRSVLALELKDVDHVRVIANMIDSELPVHEYERPDGRKSAKWTIYRTEIIQAVTEKGLVPIKSFTLTWPSDLPEELERDFVRGYFDGNGTVSFTEGSFQRIIAFSCASDDFVKSLRGVLQKHTTTPGCLSRQTKTCNSLMFRNKADIRIIGEWMYSGDGVRLLRKYEKWQQLVAQMPA